MANMTPNEQLMLELINRARMNPAGEAARYGIALNEGVPAADTISTAPKQVLAGNDSLAVSADAHSNWMFVNNQFAHVETGGAGFTGANPWDRMTAAGYGAAGTFGAGENISFRGTTAALTAVQATQWIYDQHRDLFVDLNYPGRGHRTNMLNANWDEVGIGQRLGGGYDPPPLGGGTYNASLITENFGNKTGQIFITGVIYNDTTVNDNFFTVNEQRVNVRALSAGALTDTSGAGGGYELKYAAGGVKTIEFDGTGANAAARISLTLGTTNVKVDFVNDTEVWANVSFTALTTNITTLAVLGITAVNLTAGAGNQTLIGNNANNVLAGGAGKDTLQGLLGNDTYVLGADTGASLDVVVDTGGAADAIQTTITRSLGAYAAIENLYLMGAVAINGTGNGSANYMQGNAAANTINGGAGGDTLRGLGGRDVLTGGQGATDLDFFRFNSAAEAGTGAARDVITDFAPGRDKIDLRAIDPSPAAGDQPLLFKGTTPNQANGVYYAHVGPNTIVYGDVNGDGVHDFEILLAGLKTLAAGDFQL